MNYSIPALNLITALYLTVMLAGLMFSINEGVFQPGRFYGYRSAISGIVFVCVIRKWTRGTGVLVH